MPVSFAKVKIVPKADEGRIGKRHTRSRTIE